jgi:hypothetical protein
MGTEGQRVILSLRESMSAISVDIHCIGRPFCLATQTGFFPIIRFQLTEEWRAT